MNFITTIARVRRRIRIEWWLAAVMVIATGGLIYWVPTPLPRLDTLAYQDLAGAFCGGMVIVIGCQLGESVIRALPENRQRLGRNIWLMLTIGIIALLFFNVHNSPDFPITILFESGVLAILLTVGGLTLLTGLAGWIRWRTLMRLFARSFGLWLALLVYLICSVPFLINIRLHRPLTIDPILLRMDMSLGFHLSPSETLFTWEFNRHWLELLSDNSYPLLTTFMTFIVAWIYLNRAVAQARRCITAIFLVGTLGLACYWLMPAVSPLFAFPQLFNQPANSTTQRQQADNLRHQILVGPDKIQSSLGLECNTMPSLHTGFTLVALMAAWNWRRRFFWLCLPVGLLQIVTAMTLCVHYLVDIIAAVPFAIVCWALADSFIRFFPIPNEEALPLLAATEKRRQQLIVALLLALMVSVGLLISWAHYAPISPSLAWPLILVSTGAPALAATKLYTRRSVRLDTRH